MPVSTREVLMVVRARDVATRVLRELGINFVDLGKKTNKANMEMFNTGAALTGIGLGMATVGAAGVKFIDDSVNAFIDYNKEASLTLTQVDQMGVKVEELEDIGKRVAGKIPVPFDQMQKSLFDIFSSMDVSVKDSETLLTGFSKAAVAGQTDVQTAGRATIAIMNGWRLGATDLDRVLDVQFELVRKGVGTYEEFASTIGLSIPAAVSAGQSVETLGGMLAFLTRNGLSASRASTSAARALELIADPKTVARLEDMGVSVKDANGNFRTMNDIVTQLAVNQGWAQMTAPERKQAFKDIFGTGTIQARRFFDLAIPNFQEFNSLTDSMLSSTGSLDAAYAIMFDTPASKAQMLANQYDLLKVEIGEQLLPAKVKLLEILLKFFDAWNGLSETTRKYIIAVFAIGSGLLVLIGVVTTIVGLWLMFSALAAAAGVAMATVGIVIGAVVLAIVALIAIGYLLIRNWDTIKRWAGNVWHAVREFALEAWQTLQDFWDWLTRNAVDIWHTIYTAAMSAWQSISGAVSDAWNTISSAVSTGVNAVINAAQTLWSWLETAGNWLDDHFGEGFKNVWNSLSEGVSGVVSEILPTLQALWKYIQWGYDHIVGPYLKFTMNLWMTTGKLIFGIIKSVLIPVLTILWEEAKFAFEVIVFYAKLLWENLKLVFSVIVTIITTALSTIVDIVQFWWGVAVAIWDNFGGVILSLVEVVWNRITTIISTVITIISNVIQLVMNIIQGDWSDAWENIKNILEAAWNYVWNTIVTVGNLILIFFRDLPGAILGFIGDVATLLLSKGWDIMQGLWNGILNIWGAISTWFLGDGRGNGGVKNAIVGFFGNALDWLVEAGKNIIGGLKNGITTAVEAIGDFLSGIKDSIVNGFKSVFGINSPSTVMMEIGKYIIQGLIKGAFTSAKDIPALIKSIGLNFADIAKIVGGSVWDLLGNIPEDLADVLGLDSLLTGGGVIKVLGTFEDIGKQLAAAIGWTGPHWNALRTLWQHESGWNPDAKNPSSGAYGIPQALPASKMGATAQASNKDIYSRAVAQIQWGLGYIANRYGNPIAALEAWNMRSPHWYEAGAWKILGDQLAFLHHGEMVVPAGAASSLRSRYDQSGGGGRAGSGVYIENLIVREERVVDDLDWWAKTTTAGV